MNASGGQSFTELFGELLAVYVVNAVTVVARWTYIGWLTFIVYVALVFILAATNNQDAALTVFVLIPLLAFFTVIVVVPGMALGLLLLPSVGETRVGLVVGRLVQRFIRGVVGGGWFAFSFGNDVNDILRLRWTHPWLSALLCVFAIPAVMRELRGEKEWGLWGTGACLVSALVFCLDFLQPLFR